MITAVWNGVCVASGVHTVFNGQGVAFSPCSGNNSMQNPQASFVPATVAGANANSATHFYLAGHLGSASLEFSSGGYPVWKGQFAPFGSEINPQPTSYHYKFTGKERDAESGLDYFGARYYASTMGRWMSPDWAEKPEAVPYSSLGNPQSLNLYGYVGNNPLSEADADGHCGEGQQSSCADLKVKETVSNQPTFKRNVNEQGLSSGYEGRVTFTVTKGGQPLSGAQVTETNSNHVTVNGSAVPVTKVEGTAATDSNGQVGDKIGIMKDTNGTKGDNAAIKADETTNAYKSVNTQTITIATPDGSQCSCSSVRTISNVGSDGKGSSNWSLKTTRPTTPQPVKKDPQ